MILYNTPAGTWAGSEAEWKKAMKADGFDTKGLKAKDYMKEVPVAKAALMEFLTFYNVNVIAPAGTVVPAPQTTYAPLPTPAAPAADPAQLLGLDDLFRAAPWRQQFSLAVTAFDNAEALMKGAGL